MEEDASICRFQAHLILFAVAMVILVSGENFLTLLLG
jgi:NADH:ubiquinone oxidoreductase subunit 5 (subunit L)/multisubunit Na+/H+ antiporter MnhA subunit